MLGFVLENRRWLGAGFLLAFASAPGQTWFIALFAGELRAAHGLSNGAWGALFTAATLASAGLLLWRGSLADSLRLDRLGPAVALIFAAAALMVALGASVFVLGLALMLLRLCGQGLYGLIAMTATARWFVASRGRAVAVVLLGYSLGEASLPLPAILLSDWLGWRGAWATVAVVQGLIVAPMLCWLLAADRAPRGHIAEGSPGLGRRHWMRDEVLGHWLYPALMPLMLTPPLLGTALFFHQVHIAEVKGWTLAAMAPGYGAYAAATVAATFAGGWAADRFGAHRLLPLFPLPMALSLLLLGPAAAVGDWFLALALFGAAQGCANALWGSLLPMVYGTRHLGAVRSMMSSLMVLSTAAGPGLTGIVIDLGIAMPAQATAFGALCLALLPFALWIERRLTAERARGQEGGG